MSTRQWRVTACSIAVALFGLLGGVAQGRVIYDVGYDPPDGSGTLEVVNDECLTNSDIHCIINLLTTNLVDSNGDLWTLLGPVSNISPPGFAQNIDSESNNLIGFDSIDIILAFNGSIGGDSELLSARLGGHALDTQCTATLQLFVSNATSLTSDCTGVDDHGIYWLLNPRQVPEPGSLALLAGALGGAWWARRRRSAR